MSVAWKKRIVFLILIILVLAAAGCGRKDKIKEPGNTKNEMDSEVAPMFELEALTGNKVSLEDLKGKWVVLNFWQTTCPYCVKEMSDFNKFNNDFKDSGFIVIGVNLGEGKETVEKFIKKEGIDFTILLDPSLKTISDYVVPGLPTTYFIDDKGLIYDVRTGALDYNRLVDITSICFQ